jgi:hypothetical protein
VTPRDRFEYLGIDGRIIFKWICKKKGEKTWTGLIRFEIRTSDRLF